MFDEDFSMKPIYEIARDCIRLLNLRHHAYDKIYIGRHFKETIRIHLKVMADNFRCILAKGYKFHPKLVRKGKALSLNQVHQLESFNHCCPDIETVYPRFCIDFWNETFEEQGLGLNISIHELNDVFQQWLSVWVAPHLQVKLNTAFVSVYMHIFMELLIVENYLREWF